MLVQLVCAAAKRGKSIQLRPTEWIRQRAAGGRRCPSRPTLRGSAGAPAAETRARGLGACGGSDDLMEKRNGQRPLRSDETDNVLTRRR
ncbi:hypothetical protein AOLI_G00131600 [Acnodon oligacanthus]